MARTLRLWTASGRAVEPKKPTTMKILTTMITITTMITLVIVSYHTAQPQPMTLLLLILTILYYYCYQTGRKVKEASDLL